ncbi:MAG: hypothetical protein IIY55_03240 [Blautia sp.]|nr:hypothetical protein [Blautia sp.]
MAISIGINQAKELLETGVAKAQDLVRNPDQVDDLLKKLEDYLKKVPKIGETLSDVPLMIAMVKAYITGDYPEVSPKVIITMVGSFIYLLKKDDLIDDSMMGIGLADDLGVLGAALKFCEPELRAFSAWREEKRARGFSPEAAAQTDGAVPETEDATGLEE